MLTAISPQMKRRIVPELFASDWFPVVLLNRNAERRESRRRAEAFAAAEWLAVSRSGEALRLLARYAGHEMPGSLRDWLNSDEVFEICVAGTAQKKTVHGWKLPKRQLSRNSGRLSCSLRTGSLPFAGESLMEVESPRV